MESSRHLDQFKGFLYTNSIFPSGSTSIGIEQFQMPEVKIDSRLLEELKRLEHPRYNILGKKMEGFFEIAINHSDRYDLISANLQVIEKKITLGELDFLIYDHSKQKPLHIELVYKIYLYDPAIPEEINRWIGPNRKDSFSEKLNKLQTKQFPLLYSKKTNSLLKKFDLSPEKIEQQVCFKAQLFEPYHSEEMDTSLVSKLCLTGQWYRYTDFLREPLKEFSFYTPKKKDWSISPEDNTEWFSYDQLLKNINFLFDHKKAPLVWMKTQESFYRFFVVWW